MSFVERLYDLAPGAQVEFQLKETTLKGEVNIVSKGVGRNPKTDEVHLDQVVELPSGKKRNGTICFPMSEIINMNVLEFGIFKSSRTTYQEFDCQDTPSTTPSTKTSNGSVPKGSVTSKKAKRINPELRDMEPVEVMLRTYVVREDCKLKLLMKLLKEVDVCGMSFEGQNIGRHGVLAWIILTAGKTLIPIDIDALQEKVPNFWQILDKDLFRNSKLMKIVHDSRPIADYLLHAHGIQLVNVFDTQVAHALVSYDIDKCTPSRLISLADCLEMHNRRIPSGEIAFLRRYAAEDFSTNSPMLKKPLPPPECLKLCALKVKHLIPLRENLMKKMMEKQTRCTEAHMESYCKKSKDEYLKIVQDPFSISEELLSTIVDEDFGQLII